MKLQKKGHYEMFVLNYASGRTERTYVSRVEVLQAALMNLRHVHNEYSDKAEGRRWVNWFYLGQLYRNPKQYKTIKLIKMIEKELYG